MSASHYAEIIGRDPDRSSIPEGAWHYPNSNRVQYKRRENAVDREGRNIPGGGWKPRNREAYSAPPMLMGLDPRVQVVTTPATVRRVVKFQPRSQRHESMSADMRQAPPAVPMLTQRESMSVVPMLRRERFDPNMPYPDQYYVYTPYISEKSTIPHLNPTVPYPSLSRDLLPGTTTRYGDAVFSQPYWYRDYTPASYEETWDYQINDQREYHRDLARARRMRNLV